VAGSKGFVAAAQEASCSVDACVVGIEDSFAFAVPVALAFVADVVAAGSSIVVGALVHLSLASAESDTGFEQGLESVVGMAQGSEKTVVDSQA
jgi:hypothetical protein